MNNIYYLQKSARGTQPISPKSKLYEKRIVFLEEEVNAQSVSELIAQLTLLAAEDPTLPITMVINSPGGSIRDGLVLIDVMRSLPCTVQTISLGIAASMAGVILAAGTAGHRYVSPNSYVMLHQPLVSGVPMSNCSEVEKLAKSLLDRKEQLNTLLVELTGNDLETIAKLTSQDSYLTAEEALDTGLVDAIAQGSQLYELMMGGR